MSHFAAALLAALTLDLPVTSPLGRSALIERFASYSNLSRQEEAERCGEGDSFACLMSAVAYFLDDTVPTTEVYGEISSGQEENTERSPRILVGDVSRFFRGAAIHLFVTTRWQMLDPGMIRDLLEGLDPPYESALYPLYLRRLADLGRMSEFTRDYRQTGDEMLVRLYFREALKRGPDEAFDVLKRLGMVKFSDEFDEEIDRAFNTAWKGKKTERRDYLLWRMYAYYRAFRYDRCLKVGKEFPPSNAVRDVIDWRAGLLRAMANTRMRKHADAVEIYRNLKGYLDRLELSEDDLYNFYRWSGYSYAALGRNDEAIGIYLDGAERLAGSERADDFFFYAADLERLTENWQRAEELYLKLMTEYPQTTHREVSLFLVFWIRYMQKRYDEAVASLQEIVQSTRKNSYEGVRARYWQARIDEKEGRDAAAVTAYHDIVTEQPFSYYGMLAASRLRVKNLGVAIPMRHGDDFVVSSPDRLLPELQWSLALFLAGEPLRALTFLSLTRDVIMGSGKLEDRYLAALLAQEAGGYGLAVAFVHSLPPIAGFSGPLARLRYPIMYEEEVVPHAVLYNVPPLFVYAVMRQESMFDPQAVSVSNAVGLLQMLSSTAQILADEEGYGGRITEDRLKKPFTNARFGIKFLGNLLKRYRGNMTLAAAAYNAGPGKVDRWLKRMEGMELDEFVENIPIFQTRNYVKKVLANYATYRFLYDSVIEDRFEFVLSGKPVSQKLGGEEDETRMYNCCGRGCVPVLRRCVR